MYRATGEEKYLQVLEGMVTRTGLDWSLVGDYGNIAILTMENIDKTSSLYTKIRNSILAQASSFDRVTVNSSYGVAITKFNWGSNMTVANAGVILGIAAELDEGRDYLAQLN